MDAYRLPDGQVFAPDHRGRLVAVPTDSPHRERWERYATDVPQLPPPVALSSRVLAGKGEAVFYLLAIAAVYLGLALLVVGGNGDGFALFGAVVLLAPAGVFAGYLAQRERRQVEKGDYFIDYKVGWRRSLIMLGALLWQAIDVLRE